MHIWRPGRAEHGRIPATQPARERAVAVREAPRDGAAGVWTAAPRGGGAHARAISRVRRPAPRLRADLLRRLRTRLAARVFLQDALLLPELPPEAGTALRRVGRGAGPRARGAPAVRLHHSAALAPDVRGAPRLARGAVPHRGAAAGRGLRRGGAGRAARADPLRADFRGPGELQSARACSGCRRRIRCRWDVHRAAAGARRPACRRVSACGARVSGQGAGDPGRVAIAPARLAPLRRVFGA